MKIMNTTNTPNPDFKTTLNKELDSLTVQSEEDAESVECLRWNAMALVMRKIAFKLGMDLDEEFKP